VDVAVCLHEHESLRAMFLWATMLLFVALSTQTLCPEPLQILLKGENRNPIPATKKKMPSEGIFF
jgi:hypothetical protein